MLYVVKLHFGSFKISRRLVALTALYAQYTYRFARRSLKVDHPSGQDSENRVLSGPRTRDCRSADRGIYNIKKKRITWQ